MTLTERGAEEQGRRLRPALLGDAPRSASAMQPFSERGGAASDAPLGRASDWHRRNTDEGLVQLASRSLHAPRSESAMVLPGRDQEDSGQRPAGLRSELPRSESAMHALERARAAWAKTQPQLQLFHPSSGVGPEAELLPPSAPLATAPGGRSAPGLRP